MTRRGRPQTLHKVGVGQPSMTNSYTMDYCLLPASQSVCVKRFDNRLYGIKFDGLLKVSLSPSGLPSLMNIFRDLRIEIGVRYSIMYINIPESSSVCSSISFFVSSYAAMAWNPAKLNMLPSLEYGLHTINSLFDQRISIVLLLDRFEDRFGIAKNYKPASLSWGLID